MKQRRTVRHRAGETPRRARCPKKRRKIDVLCDLQPFHTFRSCDSPEFFNNDYHADSVHPPRIQRETSFRRHEKLTQQRGCLPLIDRPKPVTPTLHFSTPPPPFHAPTSSIAFNMVRNLVIIGGSSNAEVNRKVCEQLGIPAGEILLSKFSAGETQVEIKESVRGKDVYSESSRAIDILARANKASSHPVKWRSGQR